MVLTSGVEVEAGFVLPDFRLQNPVTQETVGKEIIPATSKGVLVAVICNHCPYVVHLRSELVKLTAAYRTRDIFTLAVNANDAKNYPEDSPAQMVVYREKYGYDFPYLWDEQQEFVKKINAVCTPDFYLFDHEHRLIYHGQFDDSRPDNGVQVSGHDLQQAIECLLQGKQVATPKPSIGCSIKWLA